MLTHFIPCNTVSPKLLKLIFCKLICCTFIKKQLMSRSINRFSNIDTTAVFSD